jgi:hypothetical protein
MSHQESESAPRSTVAGSDLDRLGDCIDACLACSRACLAAAEARADQAADDEAAEVRLGLDCADLCEATGRLLSRHTGANGDLVRAFLDTCASACDAWAETCRQHDDPRSHEAVEACVTCARRCRDLAAAMA